MKRIFCVLCLVLVLALGSISVLSAPHPVPDDSNSTQVNIVAEEE